jgi:hypothetical protein
MLRSCGVAFRAEMMRILSSSSSDPQGCVDDQQHLDTLCHPEGVPSQFALDFAVKTGQMGRIVKDQDCGLETDMVLSLVGPVLCFVPSKSHAARLS